MMLSNHTSIRHIFAQLRSQFNKLKARQAHVQHFKETSLFQDGLGEFDDADAVVKSLVDEYAAAEHSSYIEWG